MPRARKTFERGRSAITGRFMTAEEAKIKKNTSIVERVKKKLKPK